MSLLPANTPIVEVNKEDQEMISAFSRHHMRFENAKKQFQIIEKQLDDLESAGVNVMEHDEGALAQLGNGYYTDDGMALSDYLEKLSEYPKQEKDRLVEEIANTRKTLEKLKVLLVGKFGNAINLQYE